MVEVTLPRRNAVSKNPSRTKQRFCVPAEAIQQIFRRFPEGHPVHIPLLFGYRCGLRHGEAYAVQWKDIDFEAKELHIQRQIQYRESETDENGNSILYFSTPKYNSFRTVQLDDETIALLKRTKEHLNTVGNGEALYFVNCNADGSFIKPRTMQHASRVIHQELNLPSFDYHSLRHTHCTELLESGVPPKVVQMRLGHKDIRTTLNIYEHITKKMEENTQEILNQMYAVSTLCPRFNQTQEESKKDVVE